jgi:hypothetical protein
VSPGISLDTVSLGQVQVVPSVIIEPIGETRNGNGPSAPGIMTGEIPPVMGRALRGVPIIGTEACARFRAPNLDAAGPNALA